MGEWTHVRLRIFPDGGVARLRIWGEPRPSREEGAEVDLACIQQGGQALACSDMFFSPMNNLILPRPAEDMGGGWETRRSRPPGDDWIIVKLGAPGVLSQVIFDTKHFKGNYPDTVALDALYWPNAPLPALVDTAAWTEIVPRFETAADNAHLKTIEAAGPWTHVRLRIYPDGGVSRLRVFGTPTDAHPTDARLDALNALEPTDAVAALMRCCGSTRWAQRKAAARPFSSWTHGHGTAEWLWAFRVGLERGVHASPAHRGRPQEARREICPDGIVDGDEQAGMASADEALVAELAAMWPMRNALGSSSSCASGLSAGEMKARLDQRMPHSPENEIRIAAGEQAKITALRLNKWESE